MPPSVAIAWLHCALPLHLVLPDFTTEAWRLWAARPVGGVSSCIGKFNSWLNLRLGENMLPPPLAVKTKLGCLMMQLGA